MVWRCPKLRRYWGLIVEEISEVFGTNIREEPRTCVLGLIEVEEVKGKRREAVLRCLFQA